MNQYLYQKEEEILLNLQMLIGDNFEEYRTELQKIKEENTYETILPFIEFVVDLISSGTNITPENLNNWWLVYSNTLEYRGESLKYVTNALRYDMSESFTKAFKVNIFTRFVRWIRSKIKTR